MSELAKRTALCIMRKFTTGGVYEKEGALDKSADRDKSLRGQWSPA